MAMVVVDLRFPGHATVVDRGGEFMRVYYEFRGMADFPNGFAEPITPRWSTDGNTIFYRRKDGGRIQIWSANADGSGSKKITEGTDDVEDFRVTSDGRRLVYSTLSGLREAYRAIDREGLTGFHYDERYSPISSSRPFPIAPVARSYSVLELQGGKLRPADTPERELLGQASMETGNWTEDSSSAGDRAWLDVPKDSFFLRGHLRVSVGGQIIACSAPECADASYPWWVNKKVRFLRREGWGRNSTAIYEWVPGAKSARRLYLTNDLFLNCVPSGSSITCLREGPVQPRRLERLDPATGQREILFDPNPEFASLRLGRVERLLSRNSFGLQSHADLVFPVGYEPGKRYPLVVVQYVSRGFLRGGTGDEYPIQAFANRGFAVLSVDKPDSVGLKALPDVIEVDRLNLKDFADRRSVLESIEIPIRTAVDRGIVDPARIGITGLSDGSSTVGYALLHSKLFSAVAMSSCCWDTTLPMRVGPGKAELFYSVGYPKISDYSESASDFWTQIAISPNAAQIRTPMLLQMSDSEYFSALQSFTALSELKRPIDMFVFPGEGHVKWQPAHRLAVYERAIDWFDYWLNDKRSFPDRAAEVKTWDDLRTTASAR